MDRVRKAVGLRSEAGTCERSFRMDMVVDVDEKIGKIVGHIPPATEAFARAMRLQQTINRLQSHLTGICPTGVFRSDSYEEDLWCCGVRSLQATVHSRAPSVRAAKNNPERQNPFFCFAHGLPRTSRRYKARVLRTSPFLIPDVPALPMCKAASSCPRQMHRKEKPFRCKRSPLISHAIPQFGGRPFEMICKYRGRSVAAAARPSISREFVPVQERDGKKHAWVGTSPDYLSKKMYRRLDPANPSGFR